MPAPPHPGEPDALTRGEVEARLSIPPRTLRLWAGGLGLDPEASTYTSPDLDRLERLRDLVVRQRYTLHGALLRLAPQPAALPHDPEPTPPPPAPAPRSPLSSALVGPLEVENGRLREQIRRLEASISSLESRLSAAEAALASERGAHALTRTRTRAHLQSILSAAERLAASPRPPGSPSQDPSPQA
ncbi:hypothetical protein L6R50_21305 [Myxococcota bacterium]|nr:hypothetical protein [Myxococcota bacterium]